jgi:hypothetical protein
MVSPFSLNAKLAKHWLSHAARPSCAASESEIASFEQIHEVCLPSDLREYVLTLNGMANDPDDSEFRFVPLSQMCPEIEIDRQGRTGMFLFVDYLQLSYWFCIELDQQKREMTRVFVGGTIDENKVVADSLASFFRIYIEDPESLTIRGCAK